MLIKSKKVLLSFIPARITKLRNFGREHRMQSTQGNLKNGTICMKMLNFMLDLREDDDIAKYLNKHGGTLFDLILRALKKYISS